MKKIRRILANLAVASVGVAAGLHARAASVDVSATYLYDSPTDIVQVTSDYLASTGYNGQYFYAGASNFNITSITAGNPGTYSTSLSVTDVQTALGYPGTPLVGYCIDISHLIWGNTPHTWEVTDLTNLTTNGRGISGPQATAIQYLWGTHFGETLGSPSKAAQFQMALWTLLYDPAYSPGSAGVSFGPYNGNDAEITAAADWASNAWQNKGTQDPIYALVNVDSPLAQSFSIALFGSFGHDNSNPVPLPEAVGLGFALLAGLGSMAALRKYRRRPARIA